MPETPLVFIIGCRRSGTSLLGTIFDSHPAMAMAHEARFPATMAGRRDRYELPTGFDVATFLGDLRREGGFRRMNLDPTVVQDALARPPVTTYADAIRRVFSTYALAQGKRCYGDKMPGYVLHLPSLAELFPEARFIHIIRDGRDVALSLVDLWFAERGVGQAAMFWKRRVEAGRSGGRRLGPSRYQEVRYEDLVEHPEETVPRLCEFAGLGFDEQMLKFFQRGDEVVARTGNPELHQRLLLPPTSGLRDWRSQMGRGDLAMFEVLAGNLLSNLGYERATSHVALGARVDAARSWAGWQWERLVTQLPNPVRRRIQRGSEE
jgi:hypothetical protein